MPHLTYPLIEPDGPILNVAIGISGVHVKILQDLGMEIPKPFMVRALVDTGASCSCIDAALIKQMGMSPTGVAHVLSPSTDGKPVLCLQYDVAITLIHPQLSRTFHNIQAAECEFKEFGFHALIGRDVLKSCLFIYDGQMGGSGGYTISF